MTSFEDRGAELKTSIDEITQEIMTKLETGEVDGITAQLNTRSSLLSELIALAANEISKNEALRDYLVDLQKRDQVIMEVITQEKDQIQNAILNLNNMEKYFGV